MLKSRQARGEVTPVEIVSKRRDNSSSNKDGDSEIPLSDQLYEAVVMGDFAAAQKLMDAGADVNHRYSPPDCTSDTCLIAAIHDSNLEMVKLLLQNGADIHLHDGEGETPLANAIFTGKVELVEILLNYGADINWHSGMSGYTPLMDAIIEKQDAIFEFLLIHGADPKVRAYGGRNTFAVAKELGWILPPELTEETAHEPQEGLVEAVGRAITGWFQRK